MANKRLLACGLAFLTAALTPSTTSSVAAIAPIALHAHTTQIAYPKSLQDGDLVFRAGTDALASMVLAHGNQSRFSHVGVLIRRENTWLVIHATPAEPGVNGGVQIEKLDAFTSSELASSVGFFRVDGMNQHLRQKVNAYLLSQLGKPFDYRFQYSDDAAQYCSELVLKALHSAGIDLEPMMTRVQVLTLTEAAIPPSSLLLSPRVRELKVGE